MRINIDEPYIYCFYFYNRIHVTPSLNYWALKILQKFIIKFSSHIVNCCYVSIDRN